MFAQLLLQGDVTAAKIQRMRSHFESGEFFIAEQLGIPALYAGLWELSGGPTGDDHVWHTFEKLRPAIEEETSSAVFGTVKSFISRVEGVSTWNQRLSPHWAC
jgi:hypothetical protein